MSHYFVPAAAERRRANRSQFILSATVAPIAIFAIGVPIAAHAQVQEITVVARKREENVQNIPVAVTAVSGDTIQKFNMVEVQDVQTATPQLIVSPAANGSGANVQLRGIGASAENIGIEQSVAVNIDGVYYGQGRAIDEGLFDTGGVQVLKGPQALFYGKNATAGALAIQTNDPSFTHSGYLTAGYTFEDEMPFIEGVVNEPVNDKLALRFSFRYSHEFGGLFHNQAYAGAYNTTDIGVTNPDGSHPTYSNQSPIPPNYFGGQQNILLRLGGKWTPTDNFTVVAKATFDRLNANNTHLNGVIYKCIGGYPAAEAGLPPQHRDTCGQNFSGSNPTLPIAISSIPGLESRGGGQDYNHYQDMNYYLRLEYNAPTFNITSTNAYQDLFNEWADDQNGNSAETIFAGEYFNWEQISTEERFTTTFKFPINFSGGFYAQKTHLHFLQDVIFAGAMDTAAPTIQDTYIAYNKVSQTNGSTYSVFGQGIWDPIQGVEITAGARYTNETKKSFFLQPFVNPTLRTLFFQYDPSNPNTIVNGNQHWTNVSPEATITWKPNPNLTIYAAYKTGYKSGGFGNSSILSVLTSPFDLQFKPETVSGYEGGIKSIWFDNQLRVNIDAYNYEYKDLQIDFFNTALFNYTTLNAASARTYGAELEVDFAPERIKGLTLHADLAYNHAQYGTFLAPCAPANLTYEEGCNILRIIDSQTTGAYHFTNNCGGTGTPASHTGPYCNFMDLSHQQLPAAPQWMATLAGEYDHPITDKWTGSLAFNARFASQYFAGGVSSLAKSLASWPGYAALDLTAGLETVDHKWRIQVIARNVTNEWIPLGIGPTPGAGASGQTGCRVSVCLSQGLFDLNASTQPPRTVTLQMTYRY